MIYYAILQTSKSVNRAGAERFSMNWVCVYDRSSTRMTSAGSNRENLREPSTDFLYVDRARAEADAQYFRDVNARQVEGTRRNRPWNRTHPSTVEIVEYLK